MIMDKIRKYGLLGSASELTLRGKILLYSLKPVRAVVTSFVGKREPDKWVFILGCYNSGTTILRTLLSKHSSFRVLPREGVRFTPELPRPEDLGWTRMWIGCPEYMVMPENSVASTADRIIRDWSPWWKMGGNIYVEKSISNLTRIKWLSDNFPNAYFVGITRDGYAASKGIQRRAQPCGVPLKRFGKRFPLRLAARQWVDANTKLLSGGKHVKRYYQISYEELVENPAKTLQGVFNFIGADKTILYNTNQGVVVGGEEVTIFDGNERSFQHLSLNDINVITAEISNIQRKLGYQVRT